MPDHTPDMQLRSAPPPRGFVIYATLVIAGAAVALSALAGAPVWRGDTSARFWMLALFVLVGELLPIPVPRRRGLDKVTISTAFAFAMLLCFGAAPAALIYAASSVIADARERTALIKIMFNAAQYVLAIAAAAGVLELAGSKPPVPVTGTHLLVILAAGLALFLANHALAGSAGALLARLPVARYLFHDFVFQVWTAGCLIALAPAVVASANANPALVPVSFLPMLAILAGGREAAANRHRAFHDPLTDLPNRSMLNERLHAALLGATHKGRSLAVMIIDLDDFKSINDTLGHEFGDVVLTDIARRLEEAVGTDGMLARLGGDEFAAVLENVGGEADAVAAAVQLLGALDRSVEIGSTVLDVTASIGIACFPQHGHTASELLRHADVALYCAKGSDTGFAVYADEDDDYSPDRLALAAQLRHGIPRGELVVHYQPMIDLHGDGIRAVEALSAGIIRSWAASLPALSYPWPSRAA
jgi:diguanylate cyclase (GGDEF)-like protein